MVIIEKPRVDIALAQGSLYGSKIHGRTTILTTSAALGESGGKLKDSNGTAVPADQRSAVLRKVSRELSSERSAATSRRLSSVRVSAHARE